MKRIESPETNPCIYATIITKTIYPNPILYAELWISPILFYRKKKTEDQEGN